MPYLIVKTRRPIRLHDSASGTPLYKEMRRQILDALARGEWRPGERLPNEADLADRFGVAVSTIRAGVGELTAAGVLVRRQGKGTFVARHGLVGQYFRYSNVYDSEQKKLLTRREITEMTRIGADSQTREVLRLPGTRTAYVHHVSAILSVAEVPVAVMELILPVARFPGLRRKHLEQTSENLYSVYQRICDVTVVRMEEAIHAGAACPTVARKLRVQTGRPILCVERIAFTFNCAPVEIRRRLYEGSAHHYRFAHEQLD